MKIRMVQMDVKAGNIGANFLNMEREVISAKEDGVELIVFPEMCVGGYLVGDEWNNMDFIAELEEYNEHIKYLAEDITIVWGNVAADRDRRNEDGRIRKYNAAYIASEQDWVKRKLWNKELPVYQAKTLLPNYRFFDDKRYFTSFKQYLEEEFPSEPTETFDSEDNAFIPFRIKGNDGKTYKVGLQVCEDLWFDDYAINPTRGLAYSEADFIVNISASPWTWQKERARAKVVKRLSANLTSDDIQMPPIVYTNPVGAQNNGKNVITFDGRNSIYNGKGELVWENTTPFKQSSDTFSFPFDNMMPRVFDEEEPYKVQEKKMHEKFKAISNGLKHISDGITNKWVIGLSGGIDSCVSAAILVSVFGKENVIGINMPTKYNSDQTKDVAFQLAKSLGIEYRVVPIDKILQAKRKAIGSSHKEYRKNMIGTIHEENEQARLRGMILADIAAVEGAFFTNNGNKAETASGYATLYGDVAGAICPLADLTKEEVYSMAEFLNYNVFEWTYHSTAIPSEVIISDFKDDELNEEKVMPTAELKDNQVDPLKFGYLCRLLEYGLMDYKKVGLETIMRAWLDRTIINDFNLDEELFYKYEFHKGSIFVHDLIETYRKFKGSTFKRVQSPPIVVTSKSAFGYDYRESILPFHLSGLAIELSMKIKDKKFY